MLRGRNRGYKSDAAPRYNKETTMEIVCLGCGNVFRTSRAEWRLTGGDDPDRNTCPACHREKKAAEKKAEAKMILFFDTETTGLVNMKKPPEDPSQPRMVQLAAVLADEDGRVYRAIGAIIRPDGWEIPEQASNVHGITTEIANKFGDGVRGLLGWYLISIEQADLVVAHNADFDMHIIKGELHREDLHMEEKPIYDTMKKSTDMVKLPGKYGYKWPKLMELYRFLFDAEFDGAHDALEDVRATARCYFEMKNRGM